MIQDRLRTFGIARLALVAAFLIFAGCAGFAAWRSHQSKALDTANSGAAAPIAGEPLAALQARVRANPEDVSGLRQLGEAQFEAGHFDEAIRAYDQASRLQPGVAAIWSALGEARVMASKHDPMPAAAVEDFHKASALDPKDPRARYFLAVARDLSGDHAGAIADWLGLLADTRPGAPWEADLRLTIEQVGKINGIAVAERLAAVRQPAPAPSAFAGAPPTGAPALAGIPGPDADQLRAAAAIPPSQQRQMAETMVARLEARLNANPANPDGWIMLVRSRLNLEQPDKARAALAAAIRANPGQAAELRAQAALLGLR